MNPICIRHLVKEASQKTSSFLHKRVVSGCNNEKIRISWFAISDSQFTATSFSNFGYQFAVGGAELFF
jgi:hypothetical protein